MSVNYKQLEDFTRRFEALSEQHQDAFMEACCKELAARLLAKVIKRTPVGDYSGNAYECKQKEKTGSFHHVGNKVAGMSGGTLRRGWTGGIDQKSTDYANSLAIHHFGDAYQIDIINPVEYASYVEYGHRTIKRDGFGWAPGHLMLTISEEEIRRSSQKILQSKLNKFMKDVFK